MYGKKITLLGAISVLCFFSLQLYSMDTSDYRVWADTHDFTEARIRWVAAEVGAVYAPGLERLLKQSRARKGFDVPHISETRVTYFMGGVPETVPSKYTETVQPETCSVRRAVRLVILYGAQKQPEAAQFLKEEIDGCTQDFVGLQATVKEQLELLRENKARASCLFYQPASLLAELLYADLDCDLLFDAQCEEDGSEKKAPLFEINWHELPQDCLMRCLQNMSDVSQVRQDGKRLLPKTWDQYPRYKLNQKLFKDLVGR